MGTQQPRGPEYPTGRRLWRPRTLRPVRPGCPGGCSRSNSRLTGTPSPVGAGGFRSSSRHPAGRSTTPWKLVLEGGQAMSSGSHPWTSQTLATGLLPYLPGWALRRVWPGRSGAAEVARATFTFAFDGTHSPPKAAGANLQLLCRLLDLGVSSLAPSSASASLQLPAPGAHRGGGRALSSRASSSRVHRALHDGLACSAARSNHRSLG